MDWYSGEKTNSVTLPINTYTYVDPTRFERPAPGDGQCRYVLYLNLDLTVKADYAGGVIRVRAVREPNQDATAYRDITVIRKNCPLYDMHRDSTEFDWLIWAEWIGASDDDYETLRWDVKVGPEFKSATMTTRYAKAFVV